MVNTVTGKVDSLREDGNFHFTLKESLKPKLKSKSKV